MNIYPKEEKDYRKLARLGWRLGIPAIEAFLELEVLDGDGRVVHSSRQRSHSWVRNTYNLLFCQAAVVENATGSGLQLIDTGGVTRSGSGTQPASGWSSSGTGNQRIYVSSGYGLLAGSGIDTFGIIVGTGAGLESFENYALASKIAAGNGAGQLAYSAMEAPLVTNEGTTKKATWARYFNNNSGALVMVNEVGICAFGTNDSSGLYMLLCRDLVSSGIGVPNTGQLKVTYIVQLTYPS